MASIVALNSVNVVYRTSGTNIMFRRVRSVSVAVGSTKIFLRIARHIRKLESNNFFPFYLVLSPSLS